MWDIDTFVADCRDAVTKSKDHLAVRELMERAMSDTSAVVDALGEPEKSGLNILHVDDDLTVLNLVWAPEITLRPHDHAMWAVIGIYGGREDNIFWRRVPDDPHGRVEAAGAKSLSTGDVAPLGKDVIHSVVNPIPKLTGALHVYGGNFFEAERHEWDPENLHEGPLDMERLKAIFNPD